MATKAQLTGMAGVYLAAAELSLRGYIVAPTSRNAQGVDLLVSNSEGTSAIPIQVKTNSTTFSFWLLSEKCKLLESDDLFYILINLRKYEREFFIIPNKEIVGKMREEKSKSSRSGQSEPSIWYSFLLEDAKPYQNKWQILDDLLLNPDRRKINAYERE